MTKDIVKLPTGLPEIAITVCVCTFRRPELAVTLRSLGAMDVPNNCRIRIIVADNDFEPTAQDVVTDLASGLAIDVCYIHAPAANISLARNACLDAATGDYVAFIDDDETASQNWLTALLDVASTTSAAAVLGPVQALYGKGAPKWMEEGDFHSTDPVWVNGEIQTGYTCNVLLARFCPSVNGRRFDLSLGRSGGEDTKFFSDIHRAGGRIAFAAHANVSEVVPPKRATLSWLCKRRFRFGQTHGHLLAGNASFLQLCGHVLLAITKAVYCFCAAVILSFSAVYRNRSFLRGLLHVGVICGLLGMREIQQYGQDVLLATGGDNRRVS
ncbi:glycosyl transferase family A [Phyllobacterium brassicacearum]|uniref:Glycosyl transferase family A n=1 Tax=Phyllobacterium brassicacearum TaxID=314235 RepID=A0A2P7BNW2_9HYPH|nr:glycosyltransferase [Phyllobacterium brassicacearum]PSH68115.1 glycosyl transferase family A [Phyllobacterium brassicacearum]TDQ29664.1 succinoglycan biosynthesis protein ExoM [Phyllobacterium brassicacearum]